MLDLHSKLGSTPSERTFTGILFDPSYSGHYRIIMMFFLYNILVPLSGYV